MYKHIIALFIAATLFSSCSNAFVNSAQRNLERQELKIFSQTMLSQKRESSEISEEVKSQKRERVLEYLNNLYTLEADFFQITGKKFKASKGYMGSLRLSESTLMLNYISPKQMKLQYVKGIDSIKYIDENSGINKTIKTDSTNFFNLFFHDPSKIKDKDDIEIEIKDTGHLVATIFQNDSVLTLIFDENSDGIQLTSMMAKTPKTKEIIMLFENLKYSKKSLSEEVEESHNAEDLGQQ